MRASRVAFAVLTLILAPAATRAVAEDGAWLGVRLGGAGELSRDAADASEPSGVVVLGIIAESPADTAGLRSRDVILAVDGTRVTAARDLISYVQQREPGSWIPLTVLRGHDELDVRVRLQARPEDLRSLRVVEGWIGIEAIDIPPGLREHFGAPAAAGVLISALESGSPSEAAGLALGDVVYEIDGTPIGSTRELGGAIGGAGVGNKVELTVARSGAMIVLEALVEAKPPARRGRR